MMVLFLDSCGLDLLFFPSSALCRRLRSDVAGGSWWLTWRHSCWVWEEVARWSKSSSSSWCLKNWAHPACSLTFIRDSAISISLLLSFSIGYQWQLASTIWLELFHGHDYPARSWAVHWAFYLAFLRFCDFGRRRLRCLLGLNRIMVFLLR